MDHKNKGKYTLPLIFLFLLIIAVVVWFVFLNPGNENSSPADQGQISAQPEGERFEFSEFYHAESGTWVVNDKDILVLKEMKFISESEKEEYTVHEVTSSDHIRIVEARQRWKRVEILKGDEVVATGWIDANNVRDAQKIDTP